MPRLSLITLSQAFQALLSQEEIYAVYAAARMSAKTSDVQAKAGVVMLEDYSATLLKASAKNAGLNVRRKEMR